MVDSITKLIEEKIKQKPAEEHMISYNSSSETLEPIYFWTLDLMNSFFGGKVEKLVDNFVSSPGGGHFSELSGKKSIMQKNFMDTMGAVNQVIKSIIQLIYDLKEFEIRIEHYDDANSKDKKKAEQGSLALKEIWINSVDMKRGAGSINALATGNLQFVTLRDAFMTANSQEEVKKLDLNDRVKRILVSRIGEFLKWRDRSEQELKNRFNIQKNYLQSQVNTLQLYSRWAKPYLKTATELEATTAGPEVVKTFNTMILELALFGKNKFDFDEAINTALLPKGLKKSKKDYYSIVIIEFHFKGIPQKAGQHYVFGGKATITFKAYSLNSEELKYFEQELKKSDVEDVLKLAGGSIESLEQLREDIEHFTKTGTAKKEEKAEEEKKKDVNPFSALFSPIFKKKKTKDKEKSEKEEKEITLKEIKKDRYEEKLIRELAEQNAKETCYTLFDVYKKAHKMPSHDSPYE